jgi:hypothetical protein
MRVTDFSAVVLLRQARPDGLAISCRTGTGTPIGRCSEYLDCFTLTIRGDDVRVRRRSTLDARGSFVQNSVAGQFRKVLKRRMRTAAGGIVAKLAGILARKGFGCLKCSDRLEEPSMTF